ncbi:MAG: hypothetical protein K0R31_2500, partial [Clostridiales bacterium]|nr:hypothetical protein [Clostridiales bacterium]
FYRIKADFIGSKFQIVEKMLVNDIFTDAASQIIKDFQDKLIDEIANYEDDMSIDVEYRKDRNSSPVRKTFYIVVQVKNNHLTWSLDIKRQIS